ncbi:carboxymuconolactone decarboxylase family protein [Streptantibioticus ferralitis]|uniref:Carboxymuconolactone decarboxylase family protein n=1 Tax=Streptantibioticus ferralitis TaxID=236510 RepID=A0ABT5Z295_9ACTN|nr:carboxymuconolactone decarboxylase family protein [Streptantibioticus ferralitis]MDF2257893.1 carboxymuconolactone decarboxylase family protein [Streptantibioticus ferralitis]
MTTTVNPAEALVPAPAPRIALGKLVPDFYKAMVALDRAASDGLDPDVRELIKIRASQLNGCAYCLDMHTRDARSQGMSEQKVIGVAVWRDTPFFTARERAALALTEAVTRLGEHGVPDEVYDEAAGLFDERELSRVLAMAITINAWNRIGVATRLTPAHRHA